MIKTYETILRQNGTPYPGVEVAVTDPSTGNPFPIFSDVNGLNPIVGSTVVTNVNGYFEFFSAGGVVNFTFTANSGLLGQIQNVSLESLAIELFNQVTTGGSFTNPTITGGTIDLSTITNALISLSAISNSAISDSTINNSAITNGTINGAAISNGTLSNAGISGGSIDNTPIGATTSSSGVFSQLTTNGTSLDQISIGAGATGARQMTFNGAINAQARMVFAADGTARWFLEKDATTESGSDSGANLVVTARSDAGANLGAVITFQRAANSPIIPNRVLAGLSGTAGSPPYTFNGDTDTGMFRPATNELGFSTGGASRLNITSDGRVYGTALHNNAGAVTGTTNQYIASGTYTPTGTNVANFSAITMNEAQWVRVGNVVTVSGSFNATSTTGATNRLGISLPIATTLGLATRLAGGGGSNSIINNTAGVVNGDTTNNRAQFNIFASTGGADSFSYVYQYQVR